VERFAIGADFEGAATGWDEGERRDAIAEFENFSRQTDGFRRVVSNRAVLDPDFGFHRTLLSCSEISGKRSRVKPHPWLDGVSPHRDSARCTGRVDEDRDLHFPARVDLKSPGGFGVVNLERNVTAGFADEPLAHMTRGDVALLAASVAMDAADGVADRAQAAASRAQRPIFGNSPARSMRRSS
jgi:hypothetical protein